MDILFNVPTKDLFLTVLAISVAWTLGSSAVLFVWKAVYWAIITIYGRIEDRRKAERFEEVRKNLFGDRGNP